MKTRYLLLTTALVAVGLAGAFAGVREYGPASAPTPGRGEPTLAEVRRATERFRDVDVPG